MPPSNKIIPFYQLRISAWKFFTLGYVLKLTSITNKFWIRFDHKLANHIYQRLNYIVDQNGIPD